MSFLPMAGRVGGGESRSKSPASLLPSPVPVAGMLLSSEPGSSSQPQKGGNRGVQVQPSGTSTAPRPNYYDVLAEGTLPSSAPEAGEAAPILQAQDRDAGQAAILQARDAAILGA